MPESTEESPRGLRFALLAHPSVQAVRFATKLALPWFFTAEEYGEAVLPSLIVFGLQHVAVFGLDEALVSARGVDAGLWRAMRRFQWRVGLALALLLVVAGLALQFVTGEELLGRLLIGLAPMLVIANRATLPTWLLVRERRFFDIFCVDLGAILAFAGVTLVAAAAGLGAWSLVAGWSANALAALALATWRSRDLVPRADLRSASWPDVRATGGQLTTAAVLGYVGERADGAAIGFALGRTALGFLENAQNLSNVLLGWGQSVADRYLLPTLAADERAEGSGAAYLRALRTTILYVLPPHIVLALASEPIVRTVLPASWHASGPLLRVLALAAAVRCADLLAVTALKAAGRGADVVRLGWTRLALVGIAIAASLSFGLDSVVLAVLGARTVSAAIAMHLASLRIDVTAHLSAAALGRARLACAFFGVATAISATWILSGPSEWTPLAQCVVIGAAAILAWVLGRLVFDASAFRAEIAGFRTRFERGRAS